MSIRCFKLHDNQLPIDAPTEIMTKMTPANDKLNLLSIQNLFQLQFKNILLYMHQVIQDTLKSYLVILPSATIM